MCIRDRATSFPCAIERFVCCVERVRDWMGSNRLKLNEDKTQVIWLGTRQQLDKNLPQTLTLRNGTVLQFSTVVNNLGILLGSQLTMADHIDAVTRSGFFQLRQLRSVRQSLTPAATKTLIHTCICQQPYRLLQPAFCWSQCSSAGQAAISSERCCSPGHWNQGV